MTASEPSLTLRRLTLRAVRPPMRRPLATKVGAFTHWPLILIDLETEQGVTGRSYLAPYLERAAGYIMPVLADLGESLAGRPVAPFDLYRDVRKSLSLLGHQGVATMALSGLDMAAWDARARVAGLPLAVYLGGTLGPVRAYNSNGLGLMPAEEAAVQARELLAEGGFAALKVRLGRDSLADDLAALRAVRSAVGPDTILVCDFNQGLNPGEALERCRALDGEGVYWIEEPIAYDDLAGHAKLAREAATPIQLGENFYGPEALHQALAAEACDYVMPDLGRIGGVTGWLRAAALAAAAGIEMSSHHYPEVSAHLMRVTPTAHWLEWVDWAEPILAAPFTAEDGAVVIPERPGSGLAWNEDAIARYRYTP